MRRPLVIVAVLYAAGLLLAEVIHTSLVSLISVGLALGLLSACWSRTRNVMLVALVIVTGWANLVSRTVITSPDDLRILLPTDPVDTAVRGKLASTPAVKMFIRDEEEKFHTLAILEVSSLQQAGQWIPACGRVMTTTPASLEGLVFRGTEVEVRGILAPPPSPVAPGLFNYRSYLMRQGIYFQLKADSTNSWHLTGEAKPALADRFLAWSQRVLERGLPERDEPLRLLEAMTLGYQTGLNNETYAPFMQSGTMHIFAISGLHIALIAGLLVAVLRVVRIPRHWCGLVVIPLIWFYTGATGWQPSAIRSTIMMTVIIGGWSLNRPSDLLNSLAAAGLVILVWDPQQLFQASFQLSFFVVLSIALLLPPIQKFGDKLLAHDPLLPREALPRWRRWLATPLRWLMLSFATSLAAWLGSLPLTAYYFHLFSPVTLLANLVIVPLSSAALACNLGSLLCGNWLPWAGELFNHGAWLWMLLMVKISCWATTLPGAFVYVPEPNVFGFAVYYTLLVGTLSGWLFRKENRRPLIVVAILVLAYVGWEWHRARTQFNLTVLPLNGGHAIHVDGPGRQNDWLVDCGTTNSVEFITKPFLRSQGLNSLPRLALTHGDLQHVGGTKILWDEFRVAKTYTSPVRFRSAIYRDLMNALEAIPARREILQRNMTNGCWAVLHPDNDDHFPQADDASLVLLGQFHDTRILLLADLGRPGQEALIDHYPDLRADIIITGLPEQGEAVCDGLIELAQPKLIIIADSEFPATKRASPALKERLARHAATVLYTRATSALTLTLQPQGWRVRGMDGTLLRSTEIDSSATNAPHTLSSAP